MRRLAVLGVAGFFLAGGVRADTVVLKSGRKLENVVVSRQDGAFVVINPFHSRHPEMTWEIPDKNRIPASKVREVIVADPPRVEYRRRATAPGLTGADHTELARFCEEHKLKAERERELLLALCAQPDNAELRKAAGESKWRAWSKGNPLADPELARREREFVRDEDESGLAARWKEMEKLGTRRKLAYLMRARRSARLPRGRRDKVPVTLRSKELEGATYCLFVSSKYDPLVPTALVVGLHGGGPGGRDRTVVTGSGEQAMPFYESATEDLGWVCVCPSALRAGWGAKENEALLDAVIDEMRMLFNIDEHRIYLTGHSMGGFGAWTWGPRRADLWAAFAPCAGGGGPDGVAQKGLPVYIYHGADDGIVGPGSDRAAAKALLGDRKKPDFVYTELTGVGHGFPAWVRDDIFRFFAGRWKDKGRKHAVWPASSFDRKPTRDEIKTFGDPSQLDDGGEDATLRELVRALAKGGGGAAAAASELSQRKDEAAAKAVARVLKSRRSPPDAKVYAASVLGAIGLPACVKALGAALRDEDYRVVEAAVAGLGATRRPEAAKYLVRGGKRLGRFFEESFYGDAIVFTEYEVRLKSLGKLATAFSEVGDAEAALPVLRAEIVTRVFAPAEMYRVAGSEDPRFKHQPPLARLRLAHALKECLVALRDPRGVELLRAIAGRWPAEPRLVAEAEAGIEALEGGNG